MTSKAFIIVVGPGGFANTSWQTDGRFPFAVLAMLAGRIA